jgi:uridine kinase
LNKNLYIIRGLPGSGKTTLANTLKTAGLVDEIISADMFFEVLAQALDKTYNEVFNVNHLATAHHMCMQLFIRALQDRKNIAVHNCFTKKEHFKEYEDCAYRMGYTTTIIIANNPRRFNDHSVPPEAYDKMEAFFEY